MAVRIMEYSYLVVENPGAKDGPCELYLQAAVLRHAGHGRDQRFSEIICIGKGFQMTNNHTRIWLILIWVQYEPGNISRRQMRRADKSDLPTAVHEITHRDGG